MENQETPRPGSLNETRDKSSKAKPTPRQGSGQASYAIPVSIIIAGILIAGAIFMGQGGTNGTDLAANVGQNAGGGPAAAANVAEVTTEDHILGDINAPVKIIEFSDLECPFCQRFHSTVQQIMDEYGESGQVAWVYRHFPLTQLHSKAVDAAVASECANELGGNLAFWKFINRYFEVTPSNNQIDLSTMPDIAEFVGLDKSEFQSCLADNSLESVVQAQYQDAVDSGGTGTPYSIVVNQDGEVFPILGAQGIESVRATIERALGN